MISIKRTAYFLILIFITHFLPITAALGADVTLAWDANSETELAGYKVYYNIASGHPYNGDGAEQGASPIVLPLENLADIDQPGFTLTGLDNSQQYFFAVTAYDQAGFESAYSVEKSIQPNKAPLKPAAPGGPIAGYADAVYVFDTSTSDPDGDPVLYMFDWGDGSQTSWGANSRSHFWTAEGSYCVKAKAGDDQGGISEWSECTYIDIRMQQFTISASAGEGGTITPAGDSVLDYGASQQFSITPDAGYCIADVIVDGVSVGPVPDYTFANVYARHTIAANFEADQDADGIPDTADNCQAENNADQTDTDKDGVGDRCDPDDDNDGLSDMDEQDIHGTDPLIADTDADGMIDGDEIRIGKNPLIDDVQPQEMVIDRSLFSILSVSSEDPDHMAEYALDGLIDTYWQTDLDEQLPDSSLSHSMVIDLGAFCTLGGLNILPCIDGPSGGQITEYKAFVSRDGVYWNGPVAEGTYLADGIEKHALFFDTLSRYFKLEIVTKYNGKPIAGAAEIKIIGIPASELVDTDGDGLTDEDEYLFYTSDSGIDDSDDDGLNDGEEVLHWGVEWNGDVDNDGLINLLDADADGDGFTDGVELTSGYDPGDFVSHPVAVNDSDDSDAAEEEVKDPNNPAEQMSGGSGSSGGSGGCFIVEVLGQ